jgi:alkylation response protein AidB-like acyl-CoA dehydrogenase
MFMNESRQMLERYAPGLDAVLAEQGLMAAEARTPAELKQLISRYRLPGLWVPTEYGGAGISPYDGIRLQRALGARCPSMALMLTMHNFTVGFCRSLAPFVPSCALMMRQVASDHLLVASAFAEGRRGAGILDSTVFMTPASDGGYVINGRKKPCTLAHTADIITAGVAIELPGGVKRTGMAVIPGHAAGIKRHTFWQVPLLAAADNHELEFQNVAVSADQVVIASDDDAQTQAIVAAGEVTGLCWFEIVASASYLGVASALAERVLLDDRVDAAERAQLGGELEFAQAALDGAVHLMQTSEPEQSLLARVLAVRFGVQQIIERCSMRAAELAGGLAFIRDMEISTLLAMTRCLAFHPVSRKAAEPMLAEWLLGRTA